MQIRAMSERITGNGTLVYMAQNCGKCFFIESYSRAVLKINGEAGRFFGTRHRETHESAQNLLSSAKGQAGAHQVKGSGAKCAVMRFARKPFAKDPSVACGKLPCIIALGGRASCRKCARPLPALAVLPCRSCLSASLTESRWSQ